MKTPDHKTKIVCTIGPASESPEMLRQLIEAGMDVARLNFSHGEFPSHRRVVDGIRTAAAAAGRHVAIMADLPGPKMRVGTIAPEPVELRPGDPFVLTTEEIVGDRGRVSVSFAPVNLTLEALTTTTKSPVSTCGVNVGLCFPRRTFAI